MLPRRLLLTCAAVLMMTVSSCGSGRAPSDLPTRRNPFETRAANGGRAGRLLFFLPDDLPRDFEIGRTSAFPGPRDDRGAGVVLARPEGRSYVDVVNVIVTSSVDDRDVSPSERAQLREVDVNGVNARLTDTELVGTALDWFRNGKSVAITGPPGSTRLVLRIARNLDLGEAVSDMVHDLPDRFVQLGSFQSSGRPSPGWSIQLRSTDNQLISIDASLVDEDAPPVIFAGGDMVAPLTVRGASGALATTTRQVSAQASGKLTQRAIWWLERPDLLITVRGTTRPQTLISIAERLHQVDRTSFTNKKLVPPPTQTTR